MKIDWSNYIARIDACSKPHHAIREFRNKLCAVPTPDYRAVLEEIKNGKTKSSRPLFSKQEDLILREVEDLCERMSPRTHEIDRLNQNLQVGIEVEFGGFELAAFKGPSDNLEPVPFNRADRVAESEERTPFSRIPFVIWEAEGVNGMTVANKFKRDSLLEYVGAPFSFSDSDTRTESQRHCVAVLDELQRESPKQRGPLPGFPEFMPIRDLIESYNERIMKRTQDRRFRVIEDKSHAFRWYYALRKQYTAYDQGNFDYPLRRIASGSTVDLFLPSEVVAKETRTLIKSPRELLGSSIEKAQAIVGEFFSGGLSRGSRRKLTGVIALFIRAAAMREYRALSSMRSAENNFVYKNSFLLACKTPINDLLRVGFSRRSQAMIASVVKSRHDNLRQRFETVCSDLRRTQPLLWVGLSRDSEAEGVAQLFEHVFVPSINPRYPGETPQAYGRTVNWAVAAGTDMKTWPFCDSIKPADAIPVQLYVTELPDGRREIEPMVVLESRLGYADRLVGFAVRRDPRNAGPRERLLQANNLSQSYPDDYDSDG